MLLMMFALLYFELLFGFSCCVSGICSKPSVRKWKDHEAYVQSNIARMLMNLFHMFVSRCFLFSTFSFALHFPWIVISRDYFACILARKKCLVRNWFWEILCSIQGFFHWENFRKPLWCKYMFKLGGGGDYGCNLWCWNLGVS